MVGLGTVIGAVLPVFVVDLGVAPPEAAYTTFFRAACIASGAAVGVLNHLLFRVVVGRRLRRLARRMQVVALNLSDVEAWSEVGPDRVAPLGRDPLAGALERRSGAKVPITLGATLVTFGFVFPALGHGAAWQVLASGIARRC